MQKTPPTQTKDPVKTVALVVIIASFLYIVWSFVGIYAHEAAMNRKEVKRVFIGSVLAVGDLDERN